MTWTDERIELLKKLVKEGIPYSQIAYRLGGVSRSAAIGKARRLGLTSPPKPEKPKAAVVPKPKPVLQPKPKPVAPPPPPVKPARVRLPPELQDDEAFEARIQEILTRSSRSITDIPSDFECKWITGDVLSGDAYYCRAYTNGTSYCEKHRMLVYLPVADYKGMAPTPRRRKRR